MLTTTLVVRGSRAYEVEPPLEAGVHVASVAPESRAGVLVTVVSTEDAAFQVSYVAVVLYSLAYTTQGQPTQVDLLQPLTVLTAEEQQALRLWLIQQSWAAWARAPLHVRRVLGCPEPPLLLADAARQTGAALATLANAALRERLPTIRAGDRHLVYLSTLDEAYQRGLLHLHRGRPRRTK
ncbi:MAG: hypothetical protein AB4911_24460 [Oscillochloridaceae bacterium umkhey_bin13]